MSLASQLKATNASLKSRGIKLVIQPRKNAFFVRGTWTDLFGVRKQRWLPLKIAATPAGVTDAEVAAVTAWTAIKKGDDPALAFAQEVETKVSRRHEQSDVIDVIDLFIEDYWSTRKKTEAAQRTWDRINNELKRLPENTRLTTRLLEATVKAKTEPDTRSRLECCKVFKRLGIFAKLQDLENLDRLRGSYEPAPVELPSDENLIAFLDEVRPTKWGWVLCAAATFGQRCGEVPSLNLNDDGTATSITLKRRGKPPSMRTCFALPSAFIERWKLHDVDIPGDVRWIKPESYSSKEGQRWVQAWRQGLRGKKVQAAMKEHLRGKFDNRLLRHCWAVRSISSGLKVSLCAKAMGHTVAVHEHEDHRWLEGETLRDELAQLDV